MTRNNTTLPQNTAGSDEKDAMRATAAQSGKSHRKNTAVIVALSMALLFSLLSTASAAAINKGAANNLKTAPVEICDQSNPCAWAMYTPSYRIEFYMRNTCKCDPSKVCLKTNDDLSLRAYVYHCETRPASATTDILPDDMVTENNDDDNN